MRRNVSFLLIAVAALVTVGLLANFTLAQDKMDKKEMKMAKPVTVEGILVDTKCYGMNSANWMADHMTPKGKMPKCAQACANMGIPVGVLKDGKQDGDLFILITPASAFADHMAKTVKITGTPAFGGAIIPNKAWVKTDKGEWEEIKIATMM